MLNLELLLLTLVLAPLFFGVYLYSIKDPGQLWRTAFALSLLLFVLSLVILLQGEGLAIQMPYFSHLGIGLESNGFALVYGVVTTLLWGVSILCSREYFQHQPQQLHRYYCALFLTLSGTLGVFFAQDLFTLFIFFELMSFSSYFWVLHKEDEEAKTASTIYLVFAVAGGMSVLMGIFSLSALSDNLSLAHLSFLFQNQALSQEARLACLYLFFGFGAKAGVFFVHDWLPLAHTASPAPASGLLSGVLTKCGVYGIVIVMLRILPQAMDFAIFVLLIALCTMFFGAVFAFLSGNLKRTLAFSTVSQMGFILWGLAFAVLLEEHKTVALYGALFHMLNHSLLKVLLFSLAGIVYHQTHCLTLSDLKGFGRGKPWFQTLFTLATLSLGGVPLFSGYISKTLLHEAVVEYLALSPIVSSLFHLYEWIFLVSGGFTVAYLLKLYHCLFLEGKETPWEKKSYASLWTLLPLSLLALLLFLLGIAPHVFFQEIGNFTAHFLQIHHSLEVDYFVLSNLGGAMISLVIGVGIHYNNKLHCQNSQQDPFRERMKLEDTFVEKLYLPLLKLWELVSVVVMRLLDVGVDTLAQRSSQKYFKSLTIPETFYYGEAHLPQRKRVEIRVTQTLAYSLLMFGLGFIFTIVYLLVVGGTLS